MRAGVLLVCLLSLSLSPQVWTCALALPVNSNAPTTLDGWSARVTLVTALTERDTGPTNLRTAWVRLLRPACFLLADCAQDNNNREVI